MTGTARVLLFSDPAMAGHQPPGHPERPERVEAVISGISDAAAAAWASLGRPAVEPAEASDLERVHPAPYLALLDDVAREGGGWIDPDTFIGPGSMMAARLAAGATIHAAHAAAAGDAEVAFAVVRPPGHHARRNRAAGFCLLNNVSVAALTLRASGLAQRIAILDWDVHHGDGTQSIFEADPDLCYASTHQMPLYPGSGDAAEGGTGPGLGSTHNVPLAPGSGDDAFTDAWLTRLLPAVEAFAPTAILISAGYDAHQSDPLAQLELTAAGFRNVAEAVGRMARAGGVGGVALTLEGGYDVDALHDSAAATVAGLLAGLSGLEAG